MKKLKMGDEIYVYLEGGYEYISVKSKNGKNRQMFNSSKYPSKIKAAYLWDEEKDGDIYEAYAFMEIPDHLKEFQAEGFTGFKHLEEEMNAIVSNTIKGKVDGREIKYVQSMNMEIVNKIAGVKVNLETRKVYEEIDPYTDINTEHVYGNLECYDRIPGIPDIKKLFKNGVIPVTYEYDIDKLSIPEYRKNILNIGVEYHLASRFLRHTSFFIDNNRKYGEPCREYVEDIEYVLNSIRCSKYFCDIHANTCLCESKKVGTDLWRGYGYEKKIVIRPIFYLKKDYEREENLGAERESEDVKKLEELEEICKNLEENIVKIKKAIKSLR